MLHWQLECSYPNIGSVNTFIEPHYGKCLPGQSKTAVFLVLENTVFPKVSSLGDVHDRWFGGHNLVA